MRRSFLARFTRALAVKGVSVKYLSKEIYSNIITEIRDRVLSADIFSNEKNRIFIECTSLQVRKILELIAYLSILANGDNKLSVIPTTVVPCSLA